jgi:hypothetical protein
VRIVQRLFADYLAGVPNRVLRDNLNATGLRSATGEVFTIASINTILRNPAYKGTLVYNRSTVSKWHRHTGGAQGRSVERYDEGTEKRPQEDWIVVGNAWPALIEAEVFDQVQAKLNDTAKRCAHVTGNRVRTNYLLSGTLCCGICGGPLMGQTYTWENKNGGKAQRRSYVCGTHHKGDYDKCPTRYWVPADVVENQVIRLIQEDLRHLKGDPKLHEYVTAELRKLCGSQVDARKGLQSRLSDIDGQIAKLTTHLGVLDVQTATTLGLYAKAKALADERTKVQGELDACAEAVPELPDAAEIARRADEQLQQLEAIMAECPLEQRRALVRTYVKSMKADPRTKEVELSIMPALFSSIATGGSGPKRERLWP